MSGQALPPGEPHPNEFASRLLDGAIAGTAASDEYGVAEGVADEGVAVTALEDVVIAEEAGEVDEIALEE